MKKFITDDRGLAHLALILLVVIVVAGIGGAGYYVMSKNKDKPASTTQSQSSTKPATVAAVVDECNKTLDDKDFCKFAGNMNLTSNFKAVLSSSQEGATTAMVIETESKDRSRVVTTTNGTVAAEYVSYDNSTYVKDITDGKWTKLTGTDDKDKTEENFVESFSKEVSDDLKDGKNKYVKEGKEACGSLTCFKYKYVDAAEPNVTTYIFFDDKDYLMRKTTSSSPDDGDMELTISYEKVSISVPSPLK